MISLFLQEASSKVDNEAPIQHKRRRSSNYAKFYVTEQENLAIHCLMHLRNVYTSYEYLPPTKNTRKRRGVNISADNSDIKGW